MILQLIGQLQSVLFDYYFLQIARKFECLKV